jgi:transcriptional regulator with XRE-family HTH domain
VSFGVASKAIRMSDSAKNGALDPQSLGEAIRLLQFRANLTREELASLAGVSPASMTNYLHDVSSPSVAVFRRIAAALAERLGVNPARMWMDLGALLDPRSPQHRETDHDGDKAALAQAMSRSLSLGDVEMFLSLHTTDVVANISGKNLLSGQYKGEEGIRQLIRQLLHLTEGRLSFEIHDVLANDAHTVILQTLRARRQDRVLESDQTVICHLRDGKVTELWIDNHDQDAFDRFWS